ncbi:toll/interleukin-1 receptor domain-containing protein [Actinophytocola glycyrrhizae]|uniref:Toll/interleukin-1 receptor domain-containing protein n=1 Tax=Actinophytocola glycyrrhizae TaxID=2044873 RepID=A0ABV9RX84_9PSEU
MTSDDGRSEVPTIFLSYAHDDDNHMTDVLELSRLLETSGIAVEFDLWRADYRQDWYAWALREIRAADFVIVVASPKYRAVGDGSADGDEHRGVQAEAAAIRELLYRDRKTWLSKILPVILPGRSTDDLPEFVQPVTASHFIIETITDSGAEGLLRVLTRQPRHVRPPRGEVPALLPKQVFSPVLRKFRWPMVKVRRTIALVATLLLTASVLALPGSKLPAAEVNADHAGETPEGDSPAHGGTTTTSPSHERPSAGTAWPGPTGTSGTGDRSRRAPAPDGEEWDAPVMPEGVPTDEMPSHQGVLDVMSVGHSFTADVDRITVTVRNTDPDDVLIRQIDVFVDDVRNGHDWGDGGPWHFVVSRDMDAGAPGYDGSSRVHGTIRMSGTEFRQPLVGRGHFDGMSLSWRRLLTFSPQRFITAAESLTIVIDVPLTHLLQSIRPDQTVGPVAEVTLDPQYGAVFTRVDLWTPDDHSFACDYIRRPEDKPVCDQVDPAAAVEFPG